jgi:4'-phosphopantetheinyl transferase EntD
VEEWSDGSRPADLERLFRRAGCEQVAAAIAPRAAAGRPAEFAEGRSLAAQCLGALGRSDADVGRGRERQPLWPAGVTGSIAHSDTTVAAVVALAPPDSVLSVGIDVETVGGVTPDMHGVLFTAAEMIALDALDEQARVERATLLFSAKEALYKAQYPLTHRFVDYPDVELAVDDLAVTISVVTAPRGVRPQAVTMFAWRSGASIVTGAVITERQSAGR